MILLVDDDADAREIVAHVLGGPERVLEAGNGREALEILRTGVQVRLIFCDLSMPVMNGREFCQHWRQDPQLRKIPVVLVSGERDLDAVHTELGTTAFIRKPVNLDAIDEAILKYYPRP